MIRFLKFKFKPNHSKIAKTIVFFNSEFGVEQKNHFKAAQIIKNNHLKFPDL